MNTLLICPGERPAVAALASTAPLACVPLLGECLIEYWLTHLAGRGVRHVRILASDRPQCVRAQTGDGSRWGLQVEVIPVEREFSTGEAAAFFLPPAPAGQEHEVILLDHLPGHPDRPLFESYADWLRMLASWMPEAHTPLRVGLREIQPGVWTGSHAQISPGARLVAPCWIGAHVHIGADAVIGPGAIVEDRAWIEDSVEISHSIVGPDTFVGRLCALDHSLAWGNVLVNCEDNSCLAISDPFVLCGLSNSTPDAAALVVRRKRRALTPAPAAPVPETAPVRSPLPSLWGSGATT